MDLKLLDHFQNHEQWRNLQVVAITSKTFGLVGRNYISQRSIPMLRVILHVKKMIDNSATSKRNDIIA